MKKLINNPECVLEDMLAGLTAAYPEYLKKLDNANVIVRANSKKDKVSVISGGGSGHEPAHAGYVGYGMLDGAVCGEVFTSPTPDQVYEAIKSTDNGQGVLVVIKNYTGDVMNFEMAKGMAEDEGIKVEEVIVNDDVAVENSLYTAGRRGIAGTVFVHKIAGAKAESGSNLEEVKRVAEKTIENVRSMGMSLSSCIVPAAGKANFCLGEDEIEIGMGIHGEPGTHREKISTADEITEHLVNKILDDMTIKNGDDVAVLVNGLGSTPNMELYIVNKKINKMLKDKGINIHKTFIGEFMTALEMAGCSISILKLDDELKELLDSKSNTPGFKVF
ncbi:dihydroxyacetone kinase subunit DhaK [Clostridium butyricum]|uniref:dihydroxyacetone kinase subunit DhaK n=1 Tax=Clostridium butyricum TaxID=1492 RepID=UPI000903B43B|nr:dihydroxyacetone kinase subunit DhaK [Clostridium butyricum]APF21683.1 dihydroxyacetone kinase, DhaK subunit [Clostridium butyricum]